ncbi:MAG TPA: polymerase [Betaproteobacteria bacterium]|jgi:predicted DNA-binding WGR domain protein|nr:polymerase [Betaproteobacteria bacterium]
MRELDQLNLFPRHLRLTRINTACNMSRFYSLQIQPDLFGGYTLIKEWGRIGSGGRIHHETFEHEVQAMDTLLAFECRKRRRGYCAS